MSGTILLVEDEQSIGSLVRDYLERDGYRVIWVRSGEHALAEFPRHPVRLMVLDIGLPGMDGFEVCRRLRAHSSVPVIMLTARDEEADRVAGLEMGADDYVPKPFSPRELVARIKAVLRRAEGLIGEPETLRAGPVRLSPAAREASVEGRPVDLTPKEFELLAYLMENAGLALSREVLLDRVWGVPDAETRTVDVHVAQLRKKLGLPDLIRTVRGVGYKLVAPGEGR